MNIHKESEGSLRVELTAEELHTFQLTYGQLNYENTKTKHLLKTVLEGAGRMTGFCQTPHRLLIEVFPAPNRGCTLYFTPLGAAAKRYRQATPRVYRFPSCDALLSALDQLQTVSKKELYRLGEHYILILHAPTASLSEFGDILPATRLNLAYIREHGKRMNPT